MPKIDETVLKQQIRDKAFDRVYLLYGNEPYLIRNYARLLCEKVCGGKPDAFCFHAFDGKKCTSADFIMEAEALPLLTERKCVSVVDFDFTALSKDEQTQLDEFWADIPETTVLVFSQPTVPVDQRKNAGKALYAAIQKAGCTVELKKRDTNGLVRFLRSRARGQKKELSHELARYMIEVCGEDLQTLENEMEKVCAYCGGEEIGQEDIDAVAVKLISADAFAMVRALLKGDYDSACRSLDQLFYQRVEPTILMGALSSIYVDAYRVKAALDADGDYTALPKLFNYKNKEFKLRNAQRDFRGKSMDYIRKALDLLFETDRKLKGSRIDRRVLLEELIGKLALLSATESL